MRTNGPSERLAQGLTLMDDEACAQVDAEVERRAAGGEPAQASRPGDDPDPLNIGWAWAGPEVPAQAVAPAPPPADAPARRQTLRTAAYLGGAVLAASVFVAVGVFVGAQGNRGREVAFAGRVTAREDAARGAGVAEVVVENRADTRAFITVVGLAPGRRPAVFSREGGRFIDVEPGATRVVKNLPASFDGATLALVVLTGTPAGEAVQSAMPDGATPDTADEAAEKLKAVLRDLGFRGAAVEVARLPGGGR
jgi:hypothetical protein